MENRKNNVLVLMSGGVDSSVAAALLKRRGYNVTGVYLKLWEERRGATNLGWEIGNPCWAHDKRDAERAAAKLKVPFFVLDVTREYQKYVMDYFVREYAAGRTPNPDVMCNMKIKFGFVLKKALKLGYDFVASGHYAKTITSPAPPFKVRGGRVGLCVARDINKDQSYFLWTLTQKQLTRILFPIGNYTKRQVRQMAKKLNLPTWAKKDSQGICFLGKVDLKEFLKKRIKSKIGPIVDVCGNLLGQHDGLAYFTIGQRHGMNIKDGRGPYFVVEKGMKTNTLVVAKAKDEKQYYVKELIAGNLNWISGQKPDKLTIKARARYREPLKSVKIKLLPSNRCRVIFDKPERAVAPGQSIVFYDGQIMIGGGVIL